MGKFATIVSPSPVQTILNPWRYFVTTSTKGQDLTAAKMLDQDSYRPSIQTNSTAAICYEAIGCPQFTTTKFDEMERRRHFDDHVRSVTSCLCRLRTKAMGGDIAIGLPFKGFTM